MTLEIVSRVVDCDNRPFVVVRRGSHPCSSFTSGRWWSIQSSRTSQPPRLRAIALGGTSDRDLERDGRSNDVEDAEHGDHLSDETDVLGEDPKQPDNPFDRALTTARSLLVGRCIFAGHAAIDVIDGGVARRSGAADADAASADRRASCTLLVRRIFSGTEAPKAIPVRRTRPTRNHTEDIQMKTLLR